MSPKIYVYTMNSRVVWFDSEIENIPVIADMYRIHYVNKPEEISLENCTNYLVKNFTKFIEEIVHSPIDPQEMDSVMLVHSKVKAYKQLKSHVMHSYKMAFPAVFSTEQDQIEMLAKSLIDYKQLDSEAIEKHELFVNRLVQEKKQILKERFINFVHLIKAANSTEELQTVSYSVVFEGINIV